MASIGRGSILAFKTQSSVVLAIDSRLVEKRNFRVLDNRYDKLIQLYPRVFMGCLAEQELCEALKNKFPIDTREFSPKSLVEVANLVKDAVNFFIEDKPSTAEILVVGALNDDEEHKIYKISKENQSWKHRVDEVLEEGVVMGGSGGRRALVEYVENNNAVNPDMTVEEGVVYGFEGIRFAGERDWCTGGDIQVVGINAADGSKRFKWAQDDPTQCTSQYLPVAPTQLPPTA